ncbi:MAG: hypothetical protein NTV36_03365 [Candidatus Staskawiczbacteria bacterium]|nr:hypothetical protein [Candidatus Staskawiczbacteria bacterium]
MICQNVDYEEFCHKICQYVPACKEGDSKNIPSFLASLNNQDETEFVLQRFEWEKIFARNKVIVSHHQGACMYPCLQPKDVLNIEPKKIGQIDVGDIAVFQRNSDILAHRVIAKGYSDGREYIITRPDTVVLKNDGQTFEQDILGKVMCIERKGKIISTEKKELSRIKRFLLILYFWPYCHKQYFWNRIMLCLAQIQQCNFYGVFAKILFKQCKGKIEFFLQAPTSSKVNSKLFKEISQEDLCVSLKGESPVLKWTIAAYINSQLIGRLSFVLKPDNCAFSGWWLYEAKIKMRYRKTNLETQFFQKIYALLKSLGINEVSVSIPKNSRLEKKIFKNMGFDEIPTSRNSSFKDTNDRFQRLVMKNIINENFYNS